MGSERRVALVTGAAGGIGAAVVRALVADGVAVAAVDRDQAALDTVLAPLVADGMAVSGFEADVTSSAQVDAVVDRIEREVGPIDYLVAAAGVLRMGPVIDFSDEDWAAILAVNVSGVFFTTRAVVRRMVARRRGVVVAVASNAANTPRSAMAAYAASKAAVTIFTKSLGLEVARYGVRCNVVAPGSTDTPMLHSMWHDDTGQAATIEGNLDAHRVGIPLRKLARPADVADAVMFLLSERAGHITMQDLTVDGGAALGA